jgi:acyl-CoA synthetase (AMP-forming)/AMP-acid ligase II
MRSRSFAKLALFRSGRAVAAAEKERALAEVETVITRLGSRGRSVLLSEPDPLRFALAFFALLDHGHSPIVLPPDPNPFQLTHLRASFRAAFTWTKAELLPPCDDGDPRADGAIAPDMTDAYGCLSSGTLGPPDLWLLGASGASANARAHAESLGIRATHTLLQSLPLHHSFGIVAYLFTALELGCALDFSPVFLTFRTLKKRPLEGAVLHTSPAQVRFLLREVDEAPPGLDILTVGAGLCDPHELEGLRARLSATKLFVTYGLTEAGPRVTTGRITDAPVTHGYVGRALRGIELSVRTDGGEMRSAGRGQLCVRSPSLARNVAPPLVTRDEVELSPNGDVVFLSRQNDLIKVGGISVYPKEVEAVARLHPDVVDGIVLKRPDPLYDEVFDLVVESATPNLDLRAFLQERLDRSQWPRRIVVVDELPRSPLGKIDRRRVLERIARSCCACG